MARRKTSSTFGRHPVARMAKTGVGLAAVAALGYIMAVAVEHGGPWLNLATPFALETQMVNPNAPTETREPRTSGGTATAAVPAGAAAVAPKRDFDYFPEHYQNQAKEPAEPIDTF